MAFSSRRFSSAGNDAGDTVAYQIVNHALGIGVVDRQVFLELRGNGRENAAPVNRHFYAP
jgi:hypothetical protein